MLDEGGDIPALSHSLIDPLKVINLRGPCSSILNKKSDGRGFSLFFLLTSFFLSCHKNFFQFSSTSTLFLRALQKIVFFSLVSKQEICGVQRSDQIQKRVLNFFFLWLRPSYPWMEIPRSLFLIWKPPAVFFGAISRGYLMSASVWNYEHGKKGLLEREREREET